MKLLEKIGLSNAELKILKIVIIASVLICTGIIIGNWVIHHSTKETAAELSQPADPLKILPIDIKANLDAAQRYMQGNDYEDALPHLKRVASIERDNFLVRKLLADAYLESGDYSKAETEYIFLADKELPDSVRSQICARKAIALFYSGEQDESMKELMACAEIHPGNAEIFCFLGQIEASRKIPSEKALEYLNKAIALDSSYIEARYQYARYLMETKEYYKAREFLLNAIELDPLHGKSHARLGMVYYYLNNFDLAKKSYQTALALNPGDFNTRYNLGELYYGDEDTAHALKEFKRTLQDNPGHVEANFKIGVLLLANSMAKEAIRHLEQANRNKPNSTRILLQLAVAYEKFGDKEKAKQIYEIILEIDSLNFIAKQKISLLSR